MMLDLGLLGFINSIYMIIVICFKIDGLTPKHSLKSLEKYGTLSKPNVKHTSVTD